MLFLDRAARLALQAILLLAALVGAVAVGFAAQAWWRLPDLDIWHTARLEVKPGLTGLWQVSGRNELEFNERVRLDIAYERHRCLGLDVQLIVRTVGCIFTQRGAN